MSSRTSRQYVSERRTKAAEETRAEILNAAKTLFVRHGIDRVTIAQVASKAGVAVSTVYALYKSKEGILRGLMETTIFGRRFQEVVARLDDVTDPVRLIALTAHVARAIYEGESAELGLMRGASAFSPAMRRLEQEFEKIRYEMQRDRVKALFAQSKQKKQLSFDEARRILWMYTSRDIYRMLVQESGWTPARYEKWLSDTLVNALVSP
jgi:AcrR family transcriptional regulator